MPYHSLNYNSQPRYIVHLNSNTPTTRTPLLERHYSNPSLTTRTSKCRILICKQFQHNKVNCVYTRSVCRPGIWNIALLWQTCILTEPQRQWFMMMARLAHRSCSLLLHSFKRQIDVFPVNEPLTFECYSHSDLAIGSQHTNISQGCDWFIQLSLLRSTSCLSICRNLLIYTAMQKKVYTHIWWWLKLTKQTSGLLLMFAHYVFTICLHLMFSPFVFT